MKGTFLRSADHVVVWVGAPTGIASTPKKPSPTEPPTYKVPPSGDVAIDVGPETSIGALTNGVTAGGDTPMLTRWIEAAPSLPSRTNAVLASAGSMATPTGSAASGLPGQRAP